MRAEERCDESIKAKAYSFTGSYMYWVISMYRSIFLQKELSMNNPSVLEALRSPFAEKQVNWRMGRTKPEKNIVQALPDYRAQVAQARLDEVLGEHQWSHGFTEVIVGSQIIAVRCKLSLFIEGQWVAKEDIAPLPVSTPDSGLTADELLKGAYANALKRAAVHWGVGRYLQGYSAWIPSHPSGALVGTPKLPVHMLPAGSIDSPDSTAVSGPVQGAAPVEVVAAVSEPVHVATPVKVVAAVSEPVQVAALVPVGGPVYLNNGELPEGISDKEKEMIADVLRKLNMNFATEMLRDYLKNKGSSKFCEAAKDYILAKVQEVETVVAQKRAAEQLAAERAEAT